MPLIKWYLVGAAEQIFISFRTFKVSNKPIQGANLLSEFWEVFLKHEIAIKVLSCNHNDNKPW